MADFQNDVFNPTNTPPIENPVTQQDKQTAASDESKQMISSEQTSVSPGMPMQETGSQPSAPDSVTPPKAPITPKEQVVPPPAPPYAPSAVPPVPNAAPMPPYGQPQTPPYGQQPYGQSQTPPPYAQPQTPPPYGQPPYGQGAYPPPTPYPVYPPVPPKKRMSTGKIIGIVLGCVFGVFLLLVAVGVASFVSMTNPDKHLEAYQQSGDLADLIDACDAYDTKIAFIGDTVEAEACFAEALSDTKAFLRAFPNADCADLYSDEEAAYNILMSDYLYLLLLNGKEEEYTQVFTKKMLERSASGNYYMDSYTFTGFVEDGVFTLSEGQKQVVYQGFDMLVAASSTEEERYLNLQEYYDCCEAFGDYAKADEIEQRLNASNAA